MASKPAKKPAKASKPSNAKATKPKVAAKPKAPVKKSVAKKPVAKPVKKAAPKQVKKSAPAPKKPVVAPKKPATPAKSASAKSKPLPPDVKSKKNEAAKPATSSSKSAKPAPAPVPAKPTAKTTNGSKAASAPAAKTKTSPAPAPVRGPVVPPPKVHKSPLDNAPEIVIKPVFNPNKLPPFYKKQQQRLIELRSVLSDLMEGMAKETIRSRPEGSDASVGGMHMGDAGSDAYDRDFALSMLTKEQDALYEINEALERMDRGVYGVCELSGRKIPEERLEALPYTRYTREMQEQIERDQMGGGRFRRPIVRSVFGLDEDGEGDEDDEEGETKESSPTESSLDFMKE